MGAPADPRTGSHQDAPADLHGRRTAVKLVASKGALDIDAEASPILRVVEGAVHPP
jgi:hypothetical protein